MLITDDPHGEIITKGGIGRMVRSDPADDRFSRKSPGSGPHRPSTRFPIRRISNDASRTVKETYPMKRSIIIMLVASAILVAGIFVAGCTSDSGSSSTQSAVSTPAQAASTAAASSEQSAAAPSGTPPADMQVNGTAPSGGMGDLQNGTAPSGTPPEGMQGNGTAPSGEKPSGTPPSGTAPTS